MFAQVVLVQNVLGDRCQGWIELETAEGHAGTHFQGDTVIQRIHGAGPPRERRMVQLQHAGYMEGINLLFIEGLYDGVAGVAFVILFRFPLGQGAAKRHGAVEVVGVRGAVAGHGTTGLGKNRRAGAVGVANAGDAQLVESPVKDEMGRGVRGRTELSFNLAAGGQFKYNQIIIA